MARQKTLQCMFKFIHREEMYVHVERGTESVGERLELGKAMEKDVALLQF